MKIIDINETRESIETYIHKCFVDAYKAENREYNRHDWLFEFVLVKNCEGIYQLLPLIVRSKFDRIYRRVWYRLDHNLMKNFGVHYGRSDKLRYETYNTTRGAKLSVDPNHTKSVFEVTRGKFKGVMISLSLFDEDYFDMPTGECMVAQTYEKLLFKYWYIDANIYRNLDESDKRRSLPDDLGHDWLSYWELYRETFGKIPGSEYEFICSSGVRRIIGGDEGES